MLVTLALLSHAAAPDAAHVLEVPGEGTFDLLQASDDGELILAVNASTVVIYDTVTGGSDQANPCAVVGAAAITYEKVFVACDDGTVKILDWDGAVATEVTGDPADLGEDAILGLWAGDSSVWAIVEDADDSTLSAYSIDAELAVDDPVALVGLDIVDVTVGDGYLWVLHDQQIITRLTMASGIVAQLYDRDGVNPTLIAPAAGGLLYGADTQGTLALMSSQSQWTLVGSQLGDIEAFGGDGEWLALLGGGEARIHTVSGTAVTADPASTFTFDGTANGVALGSDGTLYTAVDGGLVALAAGPWIEDVNATPTAVTDGDVVSVSFVVDRDCDAEIRVGDASTGDLLWSGAATEGVNQVEVTVDDSFGEADNYLFVVVSEGTIERSGYTTVTVDNPPSTPSLGNGSLGFGDGSLVLSFEGIDDADLAHYIVYVTTTPFDPADWPEGGPTFDGTDELVAPFEVESAGGQSVSATISPLTNGVTYYVAVRAVDEGGLESDMSNVVSDSPEASNSLTDISGEDGGALGCNSAGGSAGLLASLVTALAFRRRTMALGAGLLVSTAAVAAEPHDGKGDLTKQRGDFEIKYAPNLVTSDPQVSEIYEGAKRSWMLEIGPQLTRFAELDFGVGFFQVIDHPNGAVSGEDSAEWTMLTYVPLTVDLQLRADIFKEQWLVPNVRVGFDEVWWSEITDKAPGGPKRDPVRGEKRGYHYGFGGELLLDTFARSRAAMLENNSGINDTFLVVEWRKQRIGEKLAEEEGGFTLSGTELAFGLKFTY